MRWHAAERALYGPAHATARAALGEAAFAAAWEAGMALTSAELRAIATTLAGAEAMPVAATDPHTR